MIHELYKGALKRKAGVEKVKGVRTNSTELWHTRSTSSRLVDDIFAITSSYDSPKGVFSNIHSCSSKLDPFCF